MNTNEIISTFDNHISIKKVQECFPDASSTNFEFTEVSQDKVKKEVLDLNVKISSPRSSIPATILKESIEIHLSFLTNPINYTIKNGEFPDKLKNSEVIPLHEKEDSLRRKSTDQSAYCHMYQRLLNKSYINIRILTWRTNFSNTLPIFGNLMKRDIP